MGPYLEMVAWIFAGWMLAGALFGIVFGRVIDRMSPWE